MGTGRRRSGSRSGGGNRGGNRSRSRALRSRGLLYDVEKLLLGVDVHLLVDVDDVGVRRAFADAQLAGDDALRAPLGEQEEHFALASGEPGVSGRFGAALRERGRFGRVALGGERQDLSDQPFGEDEHRHHGEREHGRADDEGRIKDSGRQRVDQGTV